jgi:pyruvate,water dikinase
MLLAKLRAFNPPPALGVVPEQIADPAIVMLWGITPERLRAWITREKSNILRGFAASPGVVEGPARVIFDVAELQTVQDGEILVCSVTEPSWAPVFARVRGIVTDIGGVMSHAAIVAREYGVPAVLGTGIATKRIRTGQQLRVDGNEGTVTIFE